MKSTIRCYTDGRANGGSSRRTSYEDMVGDWDGLAYARALGSRLLS